MVRLRKVMRLKAFSGRPDLRSSTYAIEKNGVSDGFRIRDLSNLFSGANLSVDEAYRWSSVAIPLYPHCVRIRANPRNTQATESTTEPPM